MLIHISRYTLWQNRLKDLIDVYLRELQSSLQLDDPVIQILSLQPLQEFGSNITLILLNTLRITYLKDMMMNF
jgi:hypothetical protein